MAQCDILKHTYIIMRLKQYTHTFDKRLFIIFEPVWQKKVNRHHLYFNFQNKGKVYANTHTLNSSMKMFSHCGIYLYRSLEVQILNHKIYPNGRILKPSIVLSFNSSLQPTHRAQGHQRSFESNTQGLNSSKTKREFCPGVVPWCSCGEFAQRTGT